MLLKAQSRSSRDDHVRPASRPLKIDAHAPCPLPDAIVQAKEQARHHARTDDANAGREISPAAEDGLFVAAVTQDSIAAKAGVEPGDVIVHSAATACRRSRIFGAAPPAPRIRQVRIGVIRGDQLGTGVLEF